MLCNTPFSSPSESPRAYHCAGWMGVVARSDILDLSSSATGSYVTATSIAYHHQMYMLFIASYEVARLVQLNYYTNF